MQFHSPFFLFVFLPIFLILSLLPWKKIRNGCLLALGMLFAFWLQPEVFPLEIIVLVFTYGMGRGISNAIEKNGKPKVWMWVGVGVNLAILAALKIAVMLDVWDSMPVGYSFFAFMAIAYLLDIHKRQIGAEKNFLSFTNFMFWFPKMIAGPITRLKGFSAATPEEELTMQVKMQGLQRFIIGLAKKVLIANQLGSYLDVGIFNQSTPLVTTGTAWVMLLFYAIQLYYDFAGYTDMAIGLSQMVGVKLPENFDLPYTARSITEFWRRWHMTLSAWFRDYVFIPLEWQRRKLKWLKQFMNALIVFLLTGLWHGFSINFVIWGLMHGGMTALENSKTVGKKLKQAARPLQHAYTLLIVLFSWVFFRSPSFEFALGWLKALFGFGTRVDMVGYSILPTIGSTTWLAFVLGVIFALPVVNWFRQFLQRDNHYPKLMDAAFHFAHLILLIVSIVVLVPSSYLPTIYGNF